MIIDIHAHTTSRHLHGLHTTTADLDALRNYAKKFGIDKIYLMATYFPLKKSGVPNRKLLEKINGDPLFGCFGSLDMENNFSDGLSELTELAQAELISGLKLYPGYQNIVLSDPKFAPFFQLAEKHQLPVACHSGELHHCCPKNQRDVLNYRCGQDCCLLDQRGELSQPRHLEKLALNFPKVNFIACHLANPYFAGLRYAMEACPNIYTDISGQFISGTAEDTPYYRKLITEEIMEFLKLDNGPDRVLFGTDFPIQSYHDSLELVAALKLKPAMAKKLLYENSQKLLNLKK